MNLFQVLEQFFKGRVPRKKFDEKVRSEEIQKKKYDDLETELGENRKYEIRFRRKLG